MKIKSNLLNKGEESPVFSSKPIIINIYLKLPKQCLYFYPGPNGLHAANNVVLAFNFAANPAFYTEIVYYSRASNIEFNYAFYMRLNSSMQHTP